MKYPIKVVAAIIKKNNLYFIAKRNRLKYFGLKWEFPGGKVEFGESLENALKREVKEELNIKIIVHKKIIEKNYTDNKINIILIYFLCQIIKGSIKLNEHEESQWVRLEDLNKYDFVPGDKEVFNLL
jgi:8-oxo-dGTP diphosphatase